MCVDTAFLVSVDSSSCPLSPNLELLGVSRPSLSCHSPLSQWKGSSSYLAPESYLLLPGAQDATEVPVDCHISLAGSAQTEPKCPVHSWPKTHSNLHIYKSGLSRVCHTCSLTMYLLYTFCSSFLLIRGHSFKKRCVLEPFTEDSCSEENNSCVGGGSLGWLRLRVVGQEV